MENEEEIQDDFKKKIRSIMKQAGANLVADDVLQKMISCVNGMNDEQTQEFIMNTTRLSLKYAHKADRRAIRMDALNSALEEQNKN